MYWIEPEYLYVDGALRTGLGVLVSADDGAGRVVSVGRRGHDHFPVVTLPRRALLPGFVNTHSHGFQRGLRGWVQHADPGAADSFWTWREAMYALATRLDPEAFEAVTALAFAEMVRAGFTTVGEFHYVHHQVDGTPYADPDELALRVAAAARRVGIHLVLLRVAYERPGFGQAPNPRQRRFYDRDPDAVLAAVGRLRDHGIEVGLAPHSVRACSAAWLRAFARAPGVLHMHVDEQPGEIEQCLAEHGRRPVELLDECGLLGPRFTAVHLTHPDAAELARFHAGEAAVCACPTTELDLGDGFLRAWELRAPLSIGTDSHASIDPFAELRALEWHSRALTGRRNVLPHEGVDGLAATLVRIGTAHGAAALGVDAGVIAPGQRADLVALDLRRMEFAATRLLPALVFNGSPAAVADVWVGGRHVVKEGRVPGGEALALEAERALRRVAAG